MYQNQNRKVFLNLRLSGCDWSFENILLWKKVVLCIKSDFGYMNVEFSWGARMRYLILLAVFFSLKSASARSGNFVGNGGEVVVNPAGAVFLRDFFEYGIVNPSFETEIDPEIWRRISASSSPILKEVPQELLAAKLTELNKVRPLFGFMILAIIENYQWIFQDIALVSIDETLPYLALPPGHTRKTVANRYWSMIQISRELWTGLHPTHRLGLIIHEAIYSLISPQCLVYLELETGLCRQYVVRVYQIMHHLFKPDAKNNSSLQYFLNLYMPDEMRTAGRCGIGRPHAKARGGREVSAPSWKFLNSPSLLLNQETFGREICAWGPVESSRNVELHLYRDPFFIFPQVFSQDGKEKQTAPKFFPRAGYMKMTETFRSSAECREKVSYVLFHWFRPQSMAYAELDGQCQP